MSPRLSLSLSEDLAVRVRGQAEFECRSVSNMLERLVELGLARLDDGGRDAFLNDPPAPPGNQAARDNTMSLDQHPFRDDPAGILHLKHGLDYGGECVDGCPGCAVVARFHALVAERDEARLKEALLAVDDALVNGDAPDVAEWHRNHSEESAEDCLVCVVRAALAPKETGE